MIDVLVVEDDQNYLYEIQEEIGTANGDLAVFHFAGTFKDAIRRVDEVQPALILLDVIFPVDAKDARTDHLDYEAGVKLIRHVMDRGLASQIIVLSSQSKTFAVNLLIEYKAVRDYIFKDASWSEINAKIRRHIESLAHLSDAQAVPALAHQIVGDSGAIAKLRDLIAKVARKDDTTVLISGESGTGKELVAHNIHRLSGRADRPFVVVNCAAIPEALLESEFFGYMPGAFTGAIKETPGKFELAHRGTLFLDEIAEIPVALQAKLLRTLQDKTIERLGGGAPAPIDTRIIAATNRDLPAEIAAGRFREDLFYRINVYPILVPPLRDRREDIAVLARFYLNKFNREMEENKSIDDGALGALARCDWPGNVRELRNIIERLIIITDGDRITAEDVAALIARPSEDYSVTFPLGESDYKKAKAQIVRIFTRQFIEFHLRKNDFNILRTAQAIGYNREDLSTQIKQLGIQLRKKA